MRVALCVGLMIVATIGIAQDPTESTTPPDSQQVQQPEVINPVVMTVNGEPVHAAEISLVMQRIGAQMQQSGNEIDEKQLVQAAQSQVVDTKLLAQEARRRGITLPDGHVEQILAQIQQQAGGAEQLAKALQQGGMDIDHFTTSILEGELARTLVSNEIQPSVEVTDEEIAEFYETNKGQFTTPEQVHARHILVKSSAQATEEQVAEAQAKAAKIRQRALDGEDFATLAEELSEGPSAARGGDLGFFTKDRMVPPFAEAAFALQPGEISDVVKTRFGFHVITVEERREPTTHSLEQASSQIEAMVRQQKTGQAVGAVLDGLRREATIELVGAEGAAAPTVPATDDAQSD